MNQSLSSHTWLRTTQASNEVATDFTTQPPTRAPVAQNEPSEITLYAVFAVNGVLSLIGLTGNLLVCIIIIGGRKMYTIANLFLMNLAIADICVLVISYPLWVVQNILQTRWPFGSALCKIVPSVSDSFYGVSLGCMTAISIHRYRMILHAMGTQMSFLQAKAAIVFIWLISLGTISVPLYPAKLYVESTSRNAANETIAVKSCYSGWPSRNYERSYQLFLFTAWYALPLVVILWTFLRIRVYLKKQMTYDWLSTKEHSVLISNHVMGIKRALRMLAPVVVAFSILMLPWNLLRLVSIAVDIWALPNVHTYILVSGTMLVANSTINPFIYYITSKEFRQEFRKQFWLCRRFLGLVREEDEFVLGRDTLGRRCIRRIESMDGERKHNDSHMTANGGEGCDQHVSTDNTALFPIIRGHTLTSILEEERSGNVSAANKESMESNM